MRVREPSYPDAKSPTAFQDGLEFQDWVCEQLAQRGILLQNLSSKRYQLAIGENLQGFEIKLDERCTDTGRLSIEIAEKSRNDPALGWTPSGILRDDNTWLYIQGNRRILFVFAKRFLRNYFTNAKPRVEEKRGTIKTFYLYFELAQKHAAKVLDFDSVLTPLDAEDTEVREAEPIHLAFSSPGREPEPQTEPMVPIGPGRQGRLF